MGIESMPGPISPQEDPNKMADEAEEKGFIAEAQEDPEEIEQILEDEGFKEAA